MSQMISSMMSALNIQLTPQRISSMIQQVAVWEVRGHHAISLNTQSIGLHPIVFTDADRDVLFTIFGTEQKNLRALVQKCGAINPEYKVTSDPFNILATWLLHLGYQDIDNTKLRDEFLLAVSKYLHYRFFTSLVNHYFPHGAAEKYMTAAVNSLSRKFDIVIYGTWKAAIEARCHDLISTGSIHRKALETATDDKLFLYVIQDVQTRIRDKIKNVTAAYYEMRENGTTVGSRAATKETEDGKILVHTTKTLDLMIYNLQNEVLIERLFIDTETIRLVSAQFSAITQDMLRSALLSFVEIAEDQRNSGQLDLIKTNDGHELYIGIRVFLSNLIQKTYRHCIRNGVDITNQAAIYIKAKNVYSSSRIADEDIITIKQSIAYIVDLISSSRRETTKSSLRLAIILYLLVRSFHFL